MTDINPLRSSPTYQTNSSGVEKKTEPAVVKPQETESPSVNHTPQDKANHQEVPSSDSAPNKVEFANKPSDSIVVPKEIEELKQGMAKDKADLADALANPANDEAEVLNFIFDHAEKTLPKSNFARLEAKLSPVLNIPKDATPKEEAELKNAYQSQVKEAEKNKKLMMNYVSALPKPPSDQDIDTLIKYLSNSSVHLSLNEGC
jgi:hypothetical protein